MYGRCGLGRQTTVRPAIVQGTKAKATALMSGVVYLGEVAARLPTLEVSCNRCDRRGRLRTDRLLAAHGPTMPIPTLRRIIAADCPKMQAEKIHDVCGIHFPDLSKRRGNTHPRCA
jgi:hypothetical protein